jgi:phage baseplate assembly protein W
VTSVSRGWRFGHPDLGDGDAAGLPVTAARRTAMVEGTAAVRQAILLLLSTVPGERVMRPEYGCPLHRLLFATNDDTTAGLAIHYVRQAVERWEPRAEVVSVDAAPAQERAEQLDVTLVYRVRSTNDLDQLTLVVDLMGTG